MTFLPNFLWEQVFGSCELLANETYQRLSGSRPQIRHAATGAHWTRFNETARSGRPFSLCRRSRRSTLELHRLNRTADRTPKHRWEIGRMSWELVAHNKPVFDQMHPRIYAAAVGLVVWYALSAWILFDHQDDVGLP